MARILVRSGDNHEVTNQSQIITHVLGGSDGTGTFTTAGVAAVTDSGIPFVTRTVQNGQHRVDPNGNVYGFLFTDTGHRRLGIARPTTLSNGDVYSIRITTDGGTFERIGLIARQGDESYFNAGTAPSGGNVLIISFDRQTNAGDTTNPFLPVNGGVLTDAEFAILRDGVNSGSLATFEQGEIEIVAGSSFGGNIITAAIPGRTYGTGVRDASGVLVPYTITNNAKAHYVLETGYTVAVGSGGNRFYGINTTPNGSIK